MLFQAVLWRGPHPLCLKHYLISYPERVQRSLPAPNDTHSKKNHRIDKLSSRVMPRPDVAKLFAGMMVAIVHNRRT
jgi:hypothetical protein